MKTQTAEEILRNYLVKMIEDLGESNYFTVDEIMQHDETKYAISAMNEFATTQIESLRERLRDVPEFFSYTDEIDKVFNEFLKEINN